MRRRGCGRKGWDGGVLPVSWDTVRLFLHVLAATVWVGGQLTLAAVVPVLRRFGAEVRRAAARRFNQVAWAAFAVLIGTGIWNVIAVGPGVSHSSGYRGTLIAKLVAVGVSGIAAALHARARSTTGLAVFGALVGLSALAALFLGVLLAGSAWLSRRRWRSTEPTRSRTASAASQSAAPQAGQCGREGRLPVP